jgi:hypothetical protein
MIKVRPEKMSFTLYSLLEVVGASRIINICQNHVGFPYCAVQMPPPVLSEVTTAKSPDITRACNSLYDGYCSVTMNKMHVIGQGGKLHLIKPMMQLAINIGQV